MLAFEIDKQLKTRGLYHIRDYKELINKYRKLSYLCDEYIGKFDGLDQYTLKQPKYCLDSGYSPYTPHCDYFHEPSQKRCVGEVSYKFEIEKGKYLLVCDEHLDLKTAWDGDYSLSGLSALEQDYVKDFSEYVEFLVFNKIGLSPPKISRVLFMQEIDFNMSTFTYRSTKKKHRPSGE